MKRIFKVGDKVILNKNYDKHYNWWTSNLDKVMTVHTVGIPIKVEENDFTWHPDWLLPYEENLLDEELFDI